MNKFIRFLIFVLAFSLAALPAISASSYWAAVETTAASGDTSGGANQNAYSAYFWTVDNVADLFMVDKSVSAVGSYLVDNFDAGRSALSSSAASGAATEVMTADKAGKLSSEGYVDGLYGFRSTYGEAVASIGSEYLAVLFYDDGDDQEFRLMVATLKDGNVHFSDDPYEPVGTPGAWQQAIPEPSSGLLMLLGLASLALKRRRA